MGAIKTLADKVWREGPTPSNVRVRQFTDEVDELVSGDTFQLASHTVATVPTVGTAARLIYVADGDAGSPCLAVDNGTDWLRVSLGSAISET